MIGSVATSRRATAFAQALEEHRLDEAAAADQAAGDGGAGDDGPGGEPARELGSERALLLGVVEGLGALPKPQLAPEVRTVQRAQLVAAMEAACRSGAAGEPAVPEQRGARTGRGAHRAPSLGPLAKLRPRTRLTKGLAAGGLGVGVAASALGGVAAASTDALPGDSLYGFKRGMEDLQLDLAGDDADRGLVHLDHASTRLQEARRLMERARAGAALDHESLTEVRRALSGMRYDATEGHRLLSAAYERDGSIAPMRSLSSFADSHRAAWAQLRHRLPAQLADVSDQVSSVFDAMDSEVSPLADLISDARHGTADRGHDERTGRDGTDGPGSPSSSSSTDGREEHGHGTGHRPSPSGSDGDKDPLIGGGGLLGPSDGPGDTPSASDPGAPDGGLPAPDVTLPPIFPDVLPGLHGLSGGDAE